MNFTCPDCNREFSYKKTLNRHIREVHQKNKLTCKVCGATFSRCYRLEKHLTIHKRLKQLRKNYPDRGKDDADPSSKTNQPSTSRGNLNQPSTSRGNLNQPSTSRTNTSSERNLNQSGVNDLESNEVPILRNALVTTRIEANENEVDILTFTSRHREAIYAYLKKHLTERRGIKWYLVVNVQFSRQLVNSTQEVLEFPFFRGYTNTTLSEDEIYEQIERSVQKIMNSLEQFQKGGSNWVLNKILFLQVNIVSYHPLRPASYFKLPPFLKSKKALINIRNKDERCFEYSILAKLHPVEFNSERVSNYTRYLNEIDMGNIKSPFKVSPSELISFEKRNNLSINIFGFEKFVYPLFISEYECEERRQIDLLLISKGRKKHFCLIKSLSRLLSNLTKKKATTFYCRRCLHRFSKQTLRDKHIDGCKKHTPTLIEMPEEQEFTFKNYEMREKIPRYVVADFESILSPIAGPEQDNKVSHTHKINQHITCGFAYIVMNSDGTTSKPFVYRGLDAVSVFLKRMLIEADINSYMLSINIPLIMTDKQEKEFQFSSHCRVCKKNFADDDDDDRPVRDHCHLTGQFRGAAHSSCNLKIKPPKYLPCIFHNLSNYDLHLILQKAGSFKNEKLSCIPSNTERYISFTFSNIRFIDSFRFLNTSLSNLVMNLGKEGAEKFKVLNNLFEEDKAKLLLKKLPYPYEYVTSLKVFDETALPDKEAFFSTLSDKSIDEEDYEHVKLIWNTFQLKNMGDLHDLYVLTDCVQLCDVFNEFRDKCFQFYNLDVLHSFTLPGYAWQAMLFKTGVKLELLLDIDQYLFLESEIRGGVSMITHRYAAANNPLIPQTYVNDKPTSYILYLDCNNLYGTSLSDYLPIDGFKWVPESELNSLMTKIPKIPDDNNLGYIIECDLLYPPEIHAFTSDFPLAPERLSVQVSQLSPYCQDVLAEFNIPPKESNPKLIPNQMSKTKYVLHYRNLKLYLQQGMVLTKIHRALEFRQERWLRPFIEFNTEQRKLAPDEFTQSLFKLIVNSLFGKSMENLRKRIVFHLAHTKKTLLKKVSQPSFKSVTVFNKDLVGVSMRPKKITLNRPIYIGFSVLELSKHLMFDFYFNFLKQVYNDRVKLLFTDTDSFCIEVQTENVYKDLERHGDKFDFSNYPKNHFLYNEVNKKALGKFKDETSGKPIHEYVGLRSKIYSLLLSETEEKKTLKGICKTVVKNKIRHEDYKNCLFKRKRTSETMYRFQSENHELYTLKVQKAALSCYDDKRYILEDGVTSLPYGNKDIAEK